MMEIVTHPSFPGRPKSVTEDGVTLPDALLGSVEDGAA